MQENNKETKRKKSQLKTVLFDVFVVYLICIFLGFIGTLIYYIITKHFTYMTGWIFPTCFVILGLYLHQKIPDYLLWKAKEYGEHATKPKGFMAISSFLYIFCYFLYVIPFIIIWAISVNYNVSLLNENGWFNIYCSLGSTFLLLILLFMVKFLRNHFIIKKK